MFEATLREVANYLELGLQHTNRAFIGWTLLYALLSYGAFCLLLPFTFMHNSFQMSVFAYAYFAKYHAFIPLVVQWLVMPASLTITMNALNKAWACIHDCANFIRGFNAGKTDQQRAYDLVSTALTGLLCVFLTLTFSESVYLSMQYGVAHYLVMQNAQFALSHLQEALLLTMVALSTYKTMAAVSLAITQAVLHPRSQCAKFFHQARSLSVHGLMIRVWGYATVLIRAIVRAVQTASIGQGFRQVTVNVIDKGRSNAAAMLLLRQPEPVQYWDKKNEKKSDDKSLGFNRDGYQQLIQSIRQFRML